MNGGVPGRLDGVGLFETVLSVNGRMPLLPVHIDRMCRSAVALGLPAPERERVEAAARRAAAGSQGELALRIDWYAAGAELESRDAWRLEALTRPVPDLTLQRRRGCALVTLPPGYRRALPGWKTASHAASILGLRLAAAGAGNEGLFVDRSGRLLEGTATNVFITSGEREVITPAADGSLLPGVTRGWVIERLAGMGCRVREDRCSPRELIDSGGFVTGSLTGIAPVIALDGEPVSTRSEALIRQLGEAWRALMNQGL